MKKRKDQSKHLFIAQISFSPLIGGYHANFAQAFVIFFHLLFCPVRMRVANQSLRPVLGRQHVPAGQTNQILSIKELVDAFWKFEEIHQLSKYRQSEDVKENFYATS